MVGASLCRTNLLETALPTAVAATWLRQGGSGRICVAQTCLSQRCPPPSHGRSLSPRYTRLRLLPALGGETSKKQPTGLFFLRFPLVPGSGVRGPQVQAQYFNAKREGRKCVLLFLVGVTGFEPALALPSRIVVSALRHSLSADTPCFVGKNFKKTPHWGVFSSFSLDPEPLARDNQEAAGANSAVSDDKKQDASFGHVLFSMVGVTGFEPAASWSRTAARRGLGKLETYIFFVVITLVSDRFIIPQNSAKRNKPVQIYAVSCKSIYGINF